MRSLTLTAFAVFLLAGLSLAIPDPQFRGRKVSGGRGTVRNTVNSIASVKPSTSSQRVTSSSSRPRDIATSCLEKKCPNGYSQFKNKCYRVLKSETPITFREAQMKCKSESGALASDKSLEIHNFLKGLLRPYLSAPGEPASKRAFVGLFCQKNCETPSSWVYADGSKCQGNSFCDWQAVDSTNEWNAIPSNIYDTSVVAILDDEPETNYQNKLQPFPLDNTQHFMVCQSEPDSTDHLKPKNLQVKELISNVLISWDKPHCKGDISDYIFLLLGSSAESTYEKKIKCTKDSCSFELRPEECNYCVQPNVDYKYSLAAILPNENVSPAVTINKKLDVETCPNFKTPVHTVSTCRGVSELVQDGSCEPQVTWSKGSMCDAVCEDGYGFFDEPAPKYTCDQGGLWSPAGTAPECYEIVPVFSANLQFKITYKKTDIEALQHQFDGLVYKYNDIFCPYPDECGIGELEIKSALDDEGKKLSEVVLTIDTPVYNITDQAGFVALVKEAVFTVTDDNAFMTLIDYDNIELVLPVVKNQFKAEPQLCCQTCPEGHAYRLGHCVRCPNPDCK